MISPAISPPSTAPGNDPTPPMTTTTKVCTRIDFADVGRDGDHRRVDDAGEAGRHGADAEHEHEDLVDVDAERIDHRRILDARAHDHADAGAIEDEIKHDQRDRDDAEQRQAIGRIEHEADRRDADEARRRRHRLRKAAEDEADRFHEDDAEAEGDEELILGRAAVEVADDHALHHHADQHDEQRAGDDGGDERARIGVGDPAGVAAEHEHRAMREIQHAERAVDDGEARGDQRKKRAEHQPVETLRYEIRPVDHAVPKYLSRRRSSVAPHPNSAANLQRKQQRTRSRDAKAALAPRGLIRTEPLRVADAEKADGERQV